MAANITAAELAGLRRGAFSALVGDRLVVGDVVVTHPAAALYARTAAQTAGSAAKRSKDATVAEFQRHGDGASFEFVPLAIESFGRHGKQAMRFLSQWATWFQREGGTSGSLCATCGRS